MSELLEIKKMLEENTRLLHQLNEKIKKKEILSSQEAADYIGVSRYVLKGYREEGIIPHRMVGAHYRYLRKDLELFIKNKGARN